MALPEATPSAVEIIDLGTGEVQVRGPLTFATAKRARAAGRQLIELSADALEMDCSGVTESDSAGLAVLLDWLALAKRYGRGIRFKALPAAITAVAQLSNVDTFLNQGLTPKAVAALSE
jgi:phospholipid transport system transporter-binding protein